MFSKITLFLALFAASAQLALATPPACLLDALNTQANPGDIHAICGAGSAHVKSQITSLCGDHADAAMSAFSDVCKADAASSPTSSMSSTAMSTSPAMSSTPSVTSSMSLVSAGSANRTGGMITYTSTYYDEECSCTKTTAKATMASSGSSGFSSGAPGPASNRNGSAPYPISPAEGGAAPGSSSVAGIGATLSSGTAMPATAAMPYGTLARSGATYGTAGSAAGTGSSTTSPSIGQYTGAAAKGVVADSLTGVAFAVAGLAFLL